MEAGDAAAPDAQARSVDSLAVGIARDGTIRTLSRGTVLALACASALLIHTCERPMRAPVELDLIELVFFVLGVALPALTIALGIASWFSRRIAGTLAVTPEGIAVVRSGRRAFFAKRAQVEFGYVLPDARSTRVRFELRGGDAIEARVADRAEAEQLLTAANAGVGQRALRIPGRGAIGPTVRGLLAAIVGAVGGGVVVAAVRSAFPAATADHGDALFVAWLAQTVGAPLLVALRFGHPWVVIGNDGVTLHDAFAQRFVPLDAIATVAAFTDPGLGEAVVLGLRDGRAMRLPMAGASSAELGAVLARIESARRALGSSTMLDPMTALERNGRSLAQWRRNLAALLGPAHAYRTAQLTRESLTAVLADGAAPIARRLAAALALARLDRAGAAAPIRVAAAASASEPMRVALASIADDTLDDAVLDRAIGRSDPARKYPSS